MPGTKIPAPLLASHSRLFEVDDDQPEPSPPYRAQASFSHLALPSQDSPAYRSNSSLMLESDTEDVPLDGRRREGEYHPRVHYPSDVKRAPSMHRVDSDPAPYSRTDTGLSSRASSIAGTDDEDDEEDYDWSGEDDLVDEEAKFEQKMGLRQKPKKWGFKRIITLLFSSLIGSVFLAGILVTGPILVQFYWYKPHPTEHRKYVKDNVEAWLFWAAAQLIVSWFLALIVDIVPAIVTTIISIVWGHVSEHVKTRLELYVSVKGNIKPVLYAASGWVSWVILFEGIYHLYDGDDSSNSRAHYTYRIYQVIEMLFFLSVVVCAQRMLSHFIAFMFHRTAYKERIDSVSETLKVIEVLRTYKPKSRPRSGRLTPGFGSLFALGGGGAEQSRPGTPRPGTPARRQDGYDSSNDADTEESTNKKTVKGKRAIIATESIPLSPTQGGFSPHRYPPQGTGDGMRSSTPDIDAVGDVAIKAAKVLKSAVLHDARNLKGKEATESGLVWDVTNSREAKRLARSIYNTFRSKGRSYLVPSDFEVVFPTPEEAKEAFRVFDKDDNGDLSRAEIKTTLLKVYKERRSLSRSMRDVGVALKTLDRILLFFALVVLFFISLSVFSISITSSLTSLYSLGIALSFIFKNSASNAFDAIMFLFVTHPFDTGDRCFVDDENLIVKQMGLFATVFTRSDGTESYYYNSQLFNKFITNCRRSGKTAENLTMQIAWRTPQSKLDELEHLLNEWLATEENRWYVPSTSINISSIDFQRYITCTIGIPHNNNWQDWGLRNARKTAFHAAVQYYCRQLDISCVASPMPIVFVDPNGADASLPSPLPVDLASPYSPNVQVDGASPGLRDGTLPETASAMYPADEENVKPSLGFLPPQNQRMALKARRKGKKTSLRALGADGG